MEPQKAPALPAEPIQKVIELRNVREISRAVQYIEEELQTHLLLGTADTDGKKLLVQSLIAVVKNIGLGQTNSELADGIDEMLKTVGDLDQAAFDLLAGAEAQMSELAAELKVLQSSPECLGVALTLSEIDAELKRREEQRGTIGGLQEKLEDERDQMQETIRTLGQLLESGAPKATKSEKRKLEDKFDALVMTITLVVEAVAENDRKVELLIAYKNAVKLIGQGLPRGIIGEKLFDFRK